MSNYAQQISTLNLSQNIPDKYQKSQDEVGKLASSLQRILESFRTFASDINKASQTVTETATHLRKNR